ncbi:hypothetical protein Pla52o_19800 [Novipirellula galeiformis]|uniref:Uncharacterized protein n=1 Tax=Novipirellula galeiformis TaxID=2528004 RepID=A0A5C6CKG9_9BACT|nr:hypothetical protein Pla52o_19800 [Novipirellula galeiformis]
MGQPNKQTSYPPTPKHWHCVQYPCRNKEPASLNAPNAQLEQCSVRAMLSSSVVSCPAGWPPGRDHPGRRQAPPYHRKRRITKRVVIANDKLALKDCLPRKTRGQMFNAQVALTRLINLCSPDWRHHQRLPRAWVPLRHRNQALLLESVPTSGQPWSASPHRAASPL